MQKALAGVSDTGKRITTRVWQDLGLDQDELQRMDPTAAFRAIGNAIGALESPSQKAALAMEIFGRSGAELVTLFNQPELFEKATKEVGGLGKTLSDNAAKFGDLTDSISALKLRFTEIGATIASEFLPHLESVADTLDSLNFGEATRDAIKFVKALEPLSDIGKRLGGVAVWKSIFKGVAWNAKTETLQIRLSADHPMSGEFKEGAKPLSEYNPGVMLPPAWEMIDYTREIPEFLKRLPELTNGLRMQDSGIPFMADMISALERSTTLPYEERERDEPQLRDWQETSYDVNEMQRRGLGFGGENIAREQNKQVDLLTQIRDLIKSAPDKDLVWN
jgi:hypothetical protein